MILGGRSLQTDFALNVAGAGPMGKRQKEPLDKDLVLLYTLNDPYQLLPLQGREKHTLVTSAAPGIVPGIIDVVAGPGEATVVNDLPSTGGQIAIAPTDDDASHTPFAVGVERKDHLRRDEHVVEVPSAQRDRETGQAGIFQVLRVKVTSGNWSKDVFVPYSQYVAEESWNDAATQDGRTVAGSAQIQIPGAHASLQLRLGQEYEWLPARLTLERFDAVPYAGVGSSGSSLMRDFCSTLTIEDHNTGEKTTDVAHMNHPIMALLPGSMGSRWAALDHPGRRQPPRRQLHDRWMRHDRAWRTLCLLCQADHYSTNETKSVTESGGKTIA
jgi:hypothetical protein